jgi:hypothetical protein
MQDRIRCQQALPVGARRQNTYDGVVEAAGVEPPTNSRTNNLFGLNMGSTADSANSDGTTYRFLTILRSLCRSRPPQFMYHSPTTSGINGRQPNAAAGKGD